MTTTTHTQSLLDLTGGTSPWMSTEEVMELLDVARSTLDGWRRRPELGFPPPTRLPNAAIRYPRAAMASWLLSLPVPV